MSERIPNIGPKSTPWLNAVGIYTLQDLRRKGSVQTYKAVLNKGYPANFNLLWALEGAVQDRPWYSLSQQEKHKLKECLEIKNE